MNLFLPLHSCARERKPSPDYRCSCVTFRRNWCAKTRNCTRWRLTWSLLTRSANDQMTRSVLLSPMIITYWGMTRSVLSPVIITCWGMTRSVLLGPMIITYQGMTRSVLCPTIIMCWGMMYDQISYSLPRALNVLRYGQVSSRIPLLSPCLLTVLC